MFVFGGGVNNYLYYLNAETYPDISRVSIPYTYGVIDQIKYFSALNLFIVVGRQNYDTCRLSYLYSNWIKKFISLGVP